jgi:hypothetical protein
MKFAIVFLLALLVVVPAYAGPPINGTYTSTDIGGTMLPGRYSESWAGPNGRQQIGNITNKQSWNGTTLGTQWWMYCASLSAAPVLLFDGVDGSGNGFRIYESDFTGGLCVLDGSGPWGGGDASYIAPYTSYSETNTLTYQNFQVVGATATVVHMTAQFIPYGDDCMSLVINNNEELGTTDGGPETANYPAFLDGGCSATRTHGSWGDSDSFTLTISGCTIPTRTSTWGQIKALYE